MVYLVTTESESSMNFIVIYVWAIFSSKLKLHYLFLMNKAIQKTVLEIMMSHISYMSVAIGHLCVLMLEHITLTDYHEILGGGTSGSN